MMMMMIIIILIPATVFMELSSWRGHCENSPSSHDECRLSFGWPPTLKPSLWVCQWAAAIHIHRSHLLLLLGGKADAHFTVQRDGRLSQRRHWNKGVQPLPKAVYCSGCLGEQICPHWPMNKAYRVKCWSHERELVQYISYRDWCLSVWSSLVDEERMSK